ncbi:hypothetical protein EJ994_05775 [Maribacter sp. MJ134]|uniref:hypothetical protein n=1 Tax=Maribacter sp. MJ134 TaxID=2496865 RepID=UPI000F831881|nr:hypothetical protein [Maribacter sp. MJ134]AZQ58335.1 hypothetical protein EJ994_05775 [Maribacter sp. MJ134]
MKQRVINAKFCVQMLCLLISMVSCKSQSKPSSDNNSNSEIAYDLLNMVYGQNMEGVQGSLYYKTNNPYDVSSDYYSDVLKDGLDQYINYQNEEEIVKCPVGSLFTAMDKKHLDKKMMNLKVVQLDASKFDNPKALNYEIGTHADYQNVGMVKKAVHFISFPVIMNTGNGTYGVFIDQTPLGGYIYIYRKIGAKWKKLCSSTLYLV